MTTLNDARKAVYSRFLANAPEGVAYKFENEDFKPPEEGSWLELTVRHARGVQETIAPRGSRSFQRKAVVEVFVFTAPGKGMLDGDAVATAVKDIFEGESFADVDCFAGSVFEVGKVDRWNCHRVEVPLDYYETK